MNLFTEIGIDIMKVRHNCHKWCHNAEEFIEHLFGGIFNNKSQEKVPHALFVCYFIGVDNKNEMLLQKIVTS